MRGSIEQARAELAERLRERRAEIEATLLTRTYAIADPSETANPEYAQGLKAAVSAALDYGLAAVERGEERAPAVPILLLSQARLAARNDVPLDTVLRRYFAGYTLLGDFIVQEAGAANFKEPWLKRLLRDQAALFDRFLGTVTEEYGREADRRPESTDGRYSERVERLLAGELVDTSEFGYDFDGWHLGVVAEGPGAAKAVRSLAHSLDYSALIVGRPERAVWAWLGARRKPDPMAVSGSASSWLDDIQLAMGEPGQGVNGWRLTHRQANAALAIAQRRQEQNPVRYADVALLASMARDDLLVRSLNDLYISPLSQGRDGGETLLQTLHTYFSTGRNAASAAAGLGVSRQAVNARLRTVEDLLGCPLSDCAAEMEAALQLHELHGNLYS